MVSKRLILVKSNKGCCTGCVYLNINWSCPRYIGGNLCCLNDKQGKIYDHDMIFVHRPLPEVKK